MWRRLMNRYRDIDTNRDRDAGTDREKDGLKRGLGSGGG